MSLPSPYGFHNRMNPPTTRTEARARSCGEVRRRPAPCHERRLLPAVIWVVAGACACGCRDEPSGFDRFVPEAGTARAAVAAALESWRKGDPQDVVVAKRPEVHVVDKQRRPGQRMTAYDMIGEFSAENARGFAVRLTFDDTEEKPIVRYLVVGTDPIWVFRQEDYEMISHWAHPMNEAEDRSTGPDLAP